MVAVLGGAGYYFGRSPTQATAESPVLKAGMPWETGSADGAYRYHPGGDASADPKNAPSAVNVVIVPGVNLPKVSALPSLLPPPPVLAYPGQSSACILTAPHHRACTTSTTSGARTATKQTAMRCCCVAYRL